MTGSAPTHADVEALLSGDIPTHPALVELVGFIEQMRDLGDSSPSADIARVHVSAAAAISRVQTADLPRRDSPIGRLWVRLVPTPAIAVAAFVLLLGMSGVAAASNSSVPGDPLYGIDLAIERLGIGSGGTGERIEEAGVLLDRGMPSEALTHLSSAVLTSDDSAAADALHQAALRVKARAQSPDENAAIQSAVGGILEWMRQNHSRGNAYGHDVENMAKEIGREKADIGSQGKSGGNSKGNGAARP